MEHVILAERKYTKVIVVLSKLNTAVLWGRGWQWLWNGLGQVAWANARGGR